MTGLENQKAILDNKIIIKKILKKYSQKNINTDCIEWIGVFSPRGYGIQKMIQKNGIIKLSSVHRLAYKVAYGNFKEDLLVCHYCDNTKCINPEHPFLGTHQDNMRDMKQKGRAKK